MLEYTDLETRFTALCQKHYEVCDDFQRFRDLSYGMFTSAQSARAMWDALGGDKLVQSTTQAMAAR